MNFFATRLLRAPVAVRRQTDPAYPILLPGPAQFAHGTLGIGRPLLKWGKTVQHERPSPQLGRINTIPRLTFPQATRQTVREKVRLAP